MRRRILAASAIVFLAMAVALTLWFPTAEGTLAVCWRTGAILAAAWLAFDDVQRIPSWILLLLPVLLIVLVRWPRQAWVLIPAVLAYGALRRFLGPGRTISRR